MITSSIGDGPPVALVMGSDCGDEILFLLFGPGFFSMSGFLISERCKGKREKWSR